MEEIKRDPEQYYRLKDKIGEGWLAGWCIEP